MQLVVPSSKYKESFLEALYEYQQEKTNDRLDIFRLDIASLKKDFESYINRLHDETFGIGLPAGFVPSTTYWLVEEDQVIGRLSIRDRLTDKLLREGGHIGYDICPSKRNLGYGKKLLQLALPKAKELGITKVLVTCDETNIGSKKIIEANGGVFENSVEMGQDKPQKLRYWITL